MPFEFIQVAATGQGNAKDELNRLLRGGTHCLGAQHDGGTS
jgi:hypothetical protein